MKLKKIACDIYESYEYRVVYEGHDIFSIYEGRQAALGGREYLHAAKVRAATADRAIEIFEGAEGGDPMRYVVVTFGFWDRKSPVGRIYKTATGAQRAVDRANECSVVTPSSYSIIETNRPKGADVAVCPRVGERIVHP